MMMSYQIEINKEMEIIKNYQMEILEFKSRTTEMKTSLEGLNRLEQAEKNQ